MEGNENGREDGIRVHNLFEPRLSAADGQAVKWVGLEQVVINYCALRT